MSASGRESYPEVKGHDQAPWHRNAYAEVWREDPKGMIADCCGSDSNTLLCALAPTAPHVCSDPSCPGDRNRRKLEAAERLYTIALVLHLSNAGAHKTRGCADCDALSAWEAADAKP